MGSRHVEQYGRSYLRMVVRDKKRRSPLEFPRTDHYTITTFGMTVGFYPNWDGYMLWVVYDGNSVPGCEDKFGAHHMPFVYKRVGWGYPDFVLGYGASANELLNGGDKQHSYGPFRILSAAFAMLKLMDAATGRNP